MKISKEDLELIKDFVNEMESGKMTNREKKILVAGTLAGMHSNEKKVKELLNRLADLCMTQEVEYEVVNDVKDFSN